jgi:hypothetical protein
MLGTDLSFFRERKGIADEHQRQSSKSVAEII